jgi:hypothetical protein
MRRPFSEEKVYFYRKTINFEGRPHFSVSAAGMWWPRGRPTCRAGPLGMLRFSVARGL